ncbi:MAG: hypothetical protein HWN65_13645 [Candidatus Helarchaeota archaeon]|nr:hypothetical protein [Candidatus Helarchaeota archaeon]
MAANKGDIKLLEDFLTLSCEFGMDLQDEKHSFSPEVLERVYQKLKEMPERTIIEFRDVFIEAISDLSAPLEEDFDRKEELQRLNTLLVDLKESFYNALIEEKYILKYLFSWIDGMNLINEIFQVIKTFLNPPHFRRRRLQRQYDPNTVSDMMLYNTSLVFRIYEMQRHVKEGLVRSNDDMNKYLKFFAAEVTELSKFAITNNFIPKISKAEKDLFEDNAELLHRVFNVVNSR